MLPEELRQSETIAKNVNCRHPDNDPCTRSTPDGKLTNRRLIYKQPGGLDGVQNRQRGFCLGVELRRTSGN